MSFRRDRRWKRRGVRRTLRTEIDVFDVVGYERVRRARVIDRERSCGRLKVTSERDRLFGSFEFVPETLKPRRTVLEIVFLLNYSASEL